MMKCPNCNAENQEGFFCTKCGHPLDEAAADCGTTRVMPPLEDIHSSSSEKDPSIKDDQIISESPLKEPVPEKEPVSEKENTDKTSFSEPEDFPTESMPAAAVISDEAETPEANVRSEETLSADSEKPDETPLPDYIPENTASADESLTDITAEEDTHADHALHNDTDATAVGESSSDTVAENTPDADESISEAENLSEKAASSVAVAAAKDALFADEAVHEENSAQEDAAAAEEDVTSDEENTDTDDAEVETDTDSTEPSISDDSVIAASEILENNAEESPVADALKAKTAKKKSHKKALTALALALGVSLAALSGFYLFANHSNKNLGDNPTENIKNASTIVPDDQVAEDAIVGYWRHYNTGSVIEKIGTGRYRWTIEGDLYQLKFKDNSYIYEDENNNVYKFALKGSDRLQLIESADADGGLIRDPVFESGYIAGRVGQDGTMAKSLSINADAFNIVGRSYADLAGTYGPGSLSVVGDDQYIIFRAEHGNFAVQFDGETVPLKQDQVGYTVEKLTNNTTPLPPPVPNTNNDSQTNEVTPPEPTTPVEPNQNTTENEKDTESEKEKEKDKEQEYKVEIPDMPTFPSNSSIATGVVWANLGFVVNNAPDTMTVEDLSAILGIALEVGDAPANESGFAFYGMDDGYFAGTYGINDHSYYISGYGNDALSAEKTILFIQQIS